MKKDDKKEFSREAFLERVQRVKKEEEKLAAMSEEEREKYRSEISEHFSTKAILESRGNTYYDEMTRILKDEEIRQIYEKTFSKFGYYYRDADLTEDVIEQYRVGQVLVSGFPVLMMKVNWRLVRNTRFMIATAGAKPFQPDSDFRKVRMEPFLIENTAQLKVLDVRRRDGKTQILLFHLPETDLEPIRSAVEVLEKMAVLENLGTLYYQEGLPEKDDRKWQHWMAQPIGMDENGKFYDPAAFLRKEEHGISAESKKSVTGEFAERMVNKTLPGLTFFYRDIDLDAEIAGKYQAGQIIRNAILLDVSSISGSLVQNTRFLIASNKAISLTRLTTDAAKWGLHVIYPNTFFKVLDALQANGKTQILLLQIPEEGIDFYRESQIDVIDQVVEKGRKIFYDNMKMPPAPVLQEEEWLSRTRFAVGLNLEGSFFDLQYDANVNQQPFDQVWSSEVKKLIAAKQEKTGISGTKFK